MLASSLLFSTVLASSGKLNLGPDMAFDAAGPRSMIAHKMEDFAASDGAVCLDGSPGMFYYAPAADKANANNWEIYFQGGGWCYDEQDCWNRAKGHIGGSTSYIDGNSTSDIGGLMSSDCNVNPDFCNVNRVHILYCDGNSFSGNRDEPVMINGQKIYFRGKRIIDAVLKTLARDHNLAQAENVLLTGCSAGGLSTYLHADYVGETMKAIAPGLKKFKAAPISGFFLLHDTVENKPVYPDEMKNIFNLANSSGPGSLNDDCIASKSEADKWMCNFAEEVYAHIKTPIMALNSALDSWQTRCIYTSEPVDMNTTKNGGCGTAPGWSSCAQSPENCTSTQMVVMDQYEKDFMAKMTAAGPTYMKNGNAAFIHSCHTHCEAQSNVDFNKFTIGGVSMQQAVSKWWAGDGTGAAENYEPCLYNTDAGKKHECNPTCG